MYKKKTYRNISNRCAPFSDKPAAWTPSPRNFLVIKHHDKIVATLNLIPVKWSIGGIPLQVAEMGQVATLAEYRHRGLEKAYS
ncbi:MAG: GNAT family N-acetyltransferase [Candidatus Bathyarchaeota archaeon]|nr:GNAT family N-acetyltransferase [Candidatus Bathyarchaeota archaeon]